MYVAYFILTLIVSMCVTFFVAFLMKSLGIVDRPKSAKRKRHKKKVPLGGGWAIFITFFVMSILALWGTQGQFALHIRTTHIIGLFIGGLLLMIGGTIDDKYNLAAKHQIWFPIAAAIAFIIFGVGPRVITNPFGGVIDLSILTVSLGNWGDWVFISDLIVFGWLIGMMYTTKLLDGLDGLVTGIVTIGAVILCVISLQEQWYQPQVALLSIVFAGACFGFLMWNWYPAKVFLGEGGSLFAGFILGALAIISGGKIVTTLLVMGVPAVDALRVIIRRVQKKKAIYIGDREHLHFRLLDSGFKHKHAVILLYSISFLFGTSILFLQSEQRAIAFTVLLALMLLVGFWYSKKKNHV